VKETSRICRIAFVGDHLPRKCGIATYTADLHEAVAAAHPQCQYFVVAVNDSAEGYAYPDVVRFEMEEHDLSSYLRAADFLNISNVDIVCLQHEYGIYGGRAGAHILAFLRELRMPVVTTLHTVLREPSPEQQRVMEALIELSTRLIVMAACGQRILQEAYRAPVAKIDLIPHGIPDVGFVDPAYFKDQFGVEGRPPFSSPQFPDDGGPVVCRSAAAADRLHFAARLGVRTAGYPRIPAAAQRGQRRQPGAGDFDGQTDEAV
jgi:hypothetical protein